MFYIDKFPYNYYPFIAKPMMTLKEAWLQLLLLKVAQPIFRFQVQSLFHTGHLHLESAFCVIFV